MAERVVDGGDKMQPVADDWNDLAIAGESGENYLEKHTGLILVVATATLSIASLAHAETAAVLPSAG